MAERADSVVGFYGAPEKGQYAGDPACRKGFEIVVEVDDASSPHTPGEPASEDRVIRIGAGPDDIGLKIPRECESPGRILSQSHRKAIEKIDRMPGDFCASVSSIDERPFGFGTITESEPLHLVTEPSQLQRHFPEPAEAIVNEILSHLLALGEDEDFHL